MPYLQRPLAKRPLSRVELHVHLDGAIRLETLWDILRKKNLPLPGDESLADLKKAVEVKEPQTLLHFLKGFSVFMKAIIDDLEAIERMSYEFVIDQAKQGVAYTEARFCPHLLVSLNSGMKANWLLDGESGRDTGPCDGDTELLSEDQKRLREVLDVALRGISRGEEETGSKVRLILCCIRGRPEWNCEILQLCEEYKERGVVGIDIAGDEGLHVECPGGDSEDCNMEGAKVFNAALDRGIHRTVHAGEAGRAEDVMKAVTLLHAERIGHGYRVVEDEQTYRKCKELGVHFEVCPHSSFMTGAMLGLQVTPFRHPLLSFVEDGVSYSINRDDPTITGTSLDDEYRLLQEWGLTEAHITRANFEAAIHSFLPSKEKEELINLLKLSYGIVEYEVTVSPPITPSASPPAEKASGFENKKPAVTLTTWENRS